MIWELTNQVQPYAWGSRTVIPELLGRPSPADQPQAELWLGTHPRGPSLVGERSLADVVAADPRGMLGTAVADAYGARLPFLLKVLAAERPLSIQVHPSPHQARAGFADEQARGVPLDAAWRNYKDDWPKPELICALTEFHALCGCREPSRSRSLFAELVAAGAPRLRPHLEALDGAADVGQVVASLLGLSAADAAGLVAEVAAAAHELVAAAPAKARPELDWVVRLADAYPGDAGVVVSLLLNYVRLAPGEALYLPAGNMHAYLHGAGVEVMASSDNVLRGGLTEKHIDVPELLRVLDATPLTVDVLTPRVRGFEAVYPTAAEHFQLSVVEPVGEPVTLAAGGPQILLCVAGSVNLRVGDEQLAVRRGGAAFAAADAAVTVEGSGRLFRATTPPRG